MEEKIAKDISYLLRRLDIVRDKISARNESKDNFNVFSCLKIERDEEKLHSRLISSLLDPHGSHGLGFALLNHFLRVLGSNFQYRKDDIEVCSEYKKIDILLIDRKLRHALIIENKIDALDSNHEEEGQLERYYRRVIEEDYIPQKNVEVYYLTLDGHEPSEGSVSTSGRYKNLSNIVHCISYANEVLTWLRQCMQEACEKPYLRETIAQYINLIKKMTNNTEIEDRLEIIKIISKNSDALASAKLLFDNYKHIQWHTISDLFKDFYDEFESRGYTCVKRVDYKLIDNIVHTKNKRNQTPTFVVKDKRGIEITVACDYDSWLFFGLESKLNKNIDKQDIIEFIKTETDYESSKEGFHTDKDWIFNLYFECPDEKKINIWNFELDSTFRIINPKTRKETISEYLDFLEDFLYNKVDIYKYLR